MKLHLVRYVLGLLLLVANSVLSAPPTVPTLPPNPLQRPLEQGNAQSVHQMESALGAGPITRSMDSAQLGYDMPQLMAAAQRCQNAALKAGLKDESANDLAVALYCSDVGGASALVEGNVADYLQAAYWVKHTLYPSIDKVSKSHPNLVFGNGLDYADLRKLIHDTLNVSEGWSETSKELVFEAHRKHFQSHAYPVVHVRINGHEVSAFVESGGGALNTPITLVQSDEAPVVSSTKLGLVPVIDHYLRVAVEYGGSTYHTAPSLYLANNATIGPLVLHHVAVGVTTIDSIPPGVYLGDSMWRRFGEVAISRNGILLSRYATARCTPTVPLTFAADYDQLGPLVFPISLNNTTKTAKLSLAVMDPMHIGPNILAHADIDSVNTRRDHAIKGTIEIKVGGQRFSVRSARIETVWNHPFQMSLGRPILDRFTVYMQLRGGKPSICLKPNEAEGNAPTF